MTEAAYSPNKQNSKTNSERPPSGSRSVNRKVLMHLSHLHLSDGTLEDHDTMEKLKINFLWPSMDRFF